VFIFTLHRVKKTDEIHAFSLSSFQITGDGRLLFGHKLDLGCKIAAVA